MATWDSSMQLDFTDGTLMDEGDFDPVVKNLNTLRYATVFEAGARRIGAAVNIAGTETEYLRTPSFTQENGYLYLIMGSVRFRPGGVQYEELEVHQGGGLGGSSLLDVISPNSPTSGVDMFFPFSLWVKAAATAGSIYTVSLRRSGGTGSVDLQAGGWIVALRSGQASLLVDQP